MRQPPVYPGLGDMQPDINAQLGTFFDEDQPHPTFSQKMRGYDQEEVEGHLREMDARLRDMRQSYQATQQEIAYLHRQMQEQERPTYSGLGSRIEQLLRLAEEQRDEILAEARTEANQLMASAKVDAAELRAAAENETVELRATTKREVEEQIGSAEQEADNIRSNVARESEDL